MIRFSVVRHLKIIGQRQCVHEDSEVKCYMEIYLASNSIGVYIASCSVFQLAVVPDVGINSLGAAISGLQTDVTHRKHREKRKKSDGLSQSAYKSDRTWTIGIMLLSLSEHPPSVELNRSELRIMFCLPISRTTRRRYIRLRGRRKVAVRHNINNVKNVSHT